MQLLKTTVISLVMLVISFSASLVFAQDTTSQAVSKDTASQAVAQDKASQVLAQDKEKVKISGTITDAGTKEPLAGVNVVIKGTSVQTQSDTTGQFSVEAPSSDVTMVFSRPGYTTREVKAAGQTAIDVTLASDALNLGHEVVVGYGTQKKTDLTGAVTSVKADDVVKVISANVVSSLQGQAAGVYVTQSSGKPGGAGLDIQIRGLKSLKASNKPLYVVDGLPLAPGSEDVMGELNPNDIDAIDILKDAASCAIYGARGSNGVVLITTKRGLAGLETSERKLKINYDLYYGMTEIAHKLDLFNGPEWLKLKREAYRADGLDTSLSNLLDKTQLDVVGKNQWVDWQDEMFKKGSQFNNNLSVSGGTDKMQVLISLGHFSEDGIFHKSDYARNSGRLNVDYAPDPKLKISASVAISSTKANVAGGDSTIKNSGQADASGLSVIEPPAAKLRDDNGNLQLYVNSEKAISNPLFLIQESSNDNFRNRAISNAFVSYEFLPGLTYKLSGGLEYQGFNYGRYQTRAYNDGGTNYAILGNGEGINYTVDNLFTYVKELNQANNVDVTLLYGAQKNTLDSLQVSSKNLPTDLLGYKIVNQGTDLQKPVSTHDEWKLESYMGRLRYSLLKKYLLTLASRIDGSSKFGADRLYGFFPSAAVAWKIEQEDFMSKITAIDQLKLRLSLGTIGNQDIPSYQALSQATNTNYSFGGTVVNGANVNTLANPNLKWETTTQFNIGLDYSIFNSFLDGSFEFYSASTKDLLLAQAISSANGFTSIINNVGETKSHGFEANLRARIIKAKEATDFHWDISANFAAERNEIVATSFFDASGNPLDDVGNKWFVGQPIQVNYDYVFDGIWQTGEDNKLMPTTKPGDIKVKDLNGDGKITPLDRMVIGSSQPNWYGGAGNTFGFKGFELSAFFVAREGVQRKNDELDRGGLIGRWNSLRVDYWTPENPSQTFIRPHYNNQNPQYFSSMLYRDASYIALKNVTLSYSLPQSILKAINIASLKVYLQGTNLKYWTKFESYNPEADFMSYPMVRSYGFGLNIGL
jgi:TonB-dependent starch-binding outer membrane protein SusC